MRTKFKLLVFILFASRLALSQSQPVKLVNLDPTGSCNPGNIFYTYQSAQIAICDATGHTYIFLPGSGTGFGTVRSITATAPIVVTPDPLINTGDVSCAVASGTQAGCLSSADWTTFNTKGSSNLSGASCSVGEFFDTITTDTLSCHAPVGNLSGTGTSPFLAKFTGTSTIGNSQVQDDGTHATYSPLGFDVTTTGFYSWGVANNGATGTTVNHMACDDGAGAAIICSTTVATNNPFGVASTGIGQTPGTTGNTGICSLGYCTVTFDNASVANHFAQMSATVAGDLHDVGATAPTDGLPFWTISTGNASPGLAIIRQLAPSELLAGGASNQIQVNGTNTKRINNFNGTTPTTPANGKNVIFATSASGNTSSISAAIVGNGTATTYLDGTGNYSTPTGTVPVTGYKIKTCLVTIGGVGTNALALADDNDDLEDCPNDTGADLTITAVACRADAGSPTVTPILTGGGATSILSGALTCGTASYAAGSLNGTPVVHSFSGGATCSVAPCTIDANITTAGGTAKEVKIKITYTL